LFGFSFIPVILLQVGYNAGMGSGWLIGWIVDGLAKRFGPTTVAGWIVIAGLVVTVALILIR
jgi:hypothetical protein